MAASDFVQLGDLRVTIRELSVKEVREWAVKAEAGAVVDPIRRMVFDDCSLDDLAMMSDASAEQMEPYGPSLLNEIRLKAKAINPHFFRVREALIGVSRILNAEAESLASMPSSPA